MENTDHTILFYLSNSAEIYDFDRVERLLQALAKKGYYMFVDAETPTSLQAGVSPQALSEVRQFCAERQGFFMLQGFAVATEIYSKSGRRLLNGFEWSLGFDEEQGAVFINYLRHHFTVLEDEWEAYPHWLEIVQLIYNIWHPIYGYSIDPRGGVKDTPREEILAHKISYLYDINLFGPEIVDALGRERVLSAPAQIVTLLDDGGVMLVPSENILPGFTQYDYSQVAKKLGLMAP
jgi:hypothetical protein